MSSGCFVKNIDVSYFYKIGIIIPFSICHKGTLNYAEEVFMIYPEKVYIEPTKRTPWIVLEPGKIFIMGRSIIENPSIFYEPGLDWITDFVKNWTGRTKIDLGFEYINTGSIKWLYIFLKQLSESKNISNNAEITWYYEEGDEDMRELGSIIRSLIDCTFEIIEVDEMNDKFYEDFLLDHR